MNHNIDHQLSTRNLLCPMPVIRTQDQVNRMTEGQILEVIATDPGVKQDIPAWCRINGHEVLEVIEEGYEIILIIRVGKED